MSTTDTKYTPKDIADLEIKFSVPLYQRLFAWKEHEVKKLLDDLKEAFERNQEKPYYLGMFTCIHQGTHYDLIDGQQRMTVLTLLAVAFKEHEGWNNFLHGGERLNFTARTEDKEYLQAKATDRETAYANKGMEQALETTAKFLKENYSNPEARSAFVDYVFNHLTFFISELPNDYLKNPSSLNKYFETMNSQGKALEQHEILKVQLMRGQEGQERLTRIWNCVSAMDRPAISKKENESKDEYRARYADTINLCRQGRFDEALDKCRNFADSSSLVTTIDTIPATRHSSDSQQRENEEDSILTFPEFLLLVLDITTNKEGADDFYRTDKLLDRFDKGLSGTDIQTFYNNLLLYRLLLDYYVIRREFLQGQGSYTLIHVEEGNREETAKLLQFQSMLYVSSNAYYNWLRPFLIYVKEQPRKSVDMLEELKRLDNKMHPNVPSADMMVYKQVDRYWFWRLDYCLWEHRDKIFNKEEGKIVEKYVFRRNRSIEHLHPQDETHNEKWDVASINSFGNLAMISQSFNSTQSNDHIQVKIARIHEQIANKALQSIKMYKMCIDAEFKYEKWNKELAEKHESEMIKLLEEDKKL